MDLLVLAPQLSARASDLCVLEVRLIQTLTFTLLVPTALDMATAVLGRFVAAVLEVCARAPSPPGMEQAHTLARAPRTGAYVSPWQGRVIFFL